MVDRVIVFITTLATSAPSFVLATLLLLVFSIQLGLVPAWSANNQSYVLPVISLCMYPMAYITRLTKTSMLDALNQDYVRTARAKGVATYKVIFKHAPAQRPDPVVTYVGPMVAFIITGSMVVETIFSTGGLGSYFVTSINNRDYTLIMGVTIFLAILMVTANLITDIVYKLIDPRILLTKETETNESRSEETRVQQPDQSGQIQPRLRRGEERARGDERIHHLLP